jgi:hypothetical protein
VDVIFPTFPACAGVSDPGQVRLSHLLLIVRHQVRKRSLHFSACKNDHFTDRLGTNSGEAQILTVFSLQARMGGDPMLGEGVFSLRALPTNGAPLRLSATLSKDGALFSSFSSSV